VRRRALCAQSSKSAIASLADEPQSPSVTSELTSRGESPLPPVAEDEREDDEECGGRELVWSRCSALVLDVASERPFAATDLPALVARASETEEAADLPGLIGTASWNVRDLPLTGKALIPLSWSSAAKR
jgi:hypothetical protein